VDGLLEVNGRYYINWERRGGCWFRVNLDHDGVRVDRLQGRPQHTQLMHGVELNLSGRQVEALEDRIRAHLRTLGDNNPVSGISVEPEDEDERCRWRARQRARQLEEQNRRRDWARRQPAEWELPSMHNAPRFLHDLGLVGVRQDRINEVVSKLEEKAPCYAKRREGEGPLDVFFLRAWLGEVVKKCWFIQFAEELRRGGP